MKRYFREIRPTNIIVKIVAKRRAAVEKFEMNINPQITAE
jgi:hypothetical protein